MALPDGDASTAAMGILSKRLGSRYQSGRTRDWLKFKNPGRSGGEARSAARQGTVTPANISTRLRLPLLDEGDDRCVARALEDHCARR